MGSVLGAKFAKWWFLADKDVLWYVKWADKVFVILLPGLGLLSYDESGVLLLVVKLHIF